jgi:nickel/cobalt transporter (NicO) family protein
MKTRKIILILLILMICISLLSQANPFTGKSSSTKGSSALQKSSLWHTIAQWQKDMNSKLTTLLKSLGDSFNLTYFFLLMAISATFGVIHAIGPGHGKMIVGAYFLKEKSSPIKAVKIGTTIAITHSGLAILLGLIFGLIIKGMKMHGRSDIQNYIGIAGSALITLLGIYYLWQKLTDGNHLHKISSGKNEILVGVFSGLVPCPISMTIILFSLYFNVFFYGLISVIFFSVGMAFTISLIGIFMIKSRGFISQIPVKNKKKAEIFQKVFGIITSVLIIIIGVSLLLSKLSL